MVEDFGYAIEFNAIEFNIYIYMFTKSPNAT